MKVKPGDFFYVSAGTIHALGAGTLILETQQSSDTTYRVYDYDRTDDKGQQRDLHIDEAKEVLSVDTHDSCVNEIVEIHGNLTSTQFVSTRFFTVEKWETKGPATRAIENFTLVSVIAGSGQVNNLDIAKGDHFILTSICDTAEFTGDLTMVISYL